ncbi:MAG: alpha/beta hydrolase [Chloroflexi bacterium]|nr:alpha/beta hydrolase [Chloroflexota bacterium]
MKRSSKIIPGVVAGVLVIALAGVLNLTRNEAHRLITAPVETRKLPEETPADYNLPFEEVTVTSPDGIELAGWFVPSRNGAVIMMQHGYKSTRKELLNEAAMMYRHGYGSLLTSVRAHDQSGGEMITFGMHEVDDMAAWYQYLLTRGDVNPQRIGILGNSYGGMLAIQYAAQNENIKAVVANSAFSSLNDTVSTSVEYFTDLPAFPFAPLIVFWAERETGFKTEDIDTTKWIAQISPRPVFLMQGGADVVISADSGQRLYDAAGEPKELWFDPELGHVQFDTERAEEYERRVAEFFDRYLLDQ